MNYLIFCFFNTVAFYFIIWKYLDKQLADTAEII